MLRLKSKPKPANVWRWRDHDIAFTSAGDGEGVLLVHGIYAGSSSYEFRKLVPLLSGTRRVVAIDLLGNGLSDRPKMTYTPQLFIDLIVDAVARFQTPSLVGSSLGGAFAIHAAARVSSLRRLAVISPTGLGGILDKPPTAFQRAFTRFVMSSPGQAFFDVLATKPSLRWFLVNQAYANPAFVTPEVLSHYSWMTHLPGARYVPAHFVGGALNTDVTADLERLDIPVLIAWGERSGIAAPVSAAPEFIKHAKRATLTTFAHSRLLPHEEEPELMAQRLEAFFSH